MKAGDVLDFGYRILVVVFVVVATMLIIGALREGDVPGAIDAVTKLVKVQE